MTAIAQWYGEDRGFLEVRKTSDLIFPQRAIAGNVSAIALPEGAIAEMRSRKLPLAEKGWEELASQSNLTVQQLSEIALGASSTDAEISAIAALLKFTRQPDGSPWSESDLKALVDRNFDEGEFDDEEA